MIEKIIVLVGFLNVGNIAHVDSLLKELRNYLPTNVTELRLDVTGDDEQLQTQFKTAVDQDKKNLVLVVGENAAAKYKQLIDSTKFSPDNSYVYAGLSQLAPEISNVPIDHVAIPRTSLSESELAAMSEHVPHLSLTFAVPNTNPTIDDLKTFYNQWRKDHTLAADGNYIFVLLPGDAPVNQNEMRYFSKDSAIELAQKVKKLWQDLGRKHTVIVHNSPRTGKHDPANGKVACTHQVDGKYDETQAHDEISKEFMHQMQFLKVPTKFYRFVFKMDGGQKAVSSLNAFYYLLSQNSNNILILPGESVSMMGQAPLYASAKQIIVFKPSSMNDNHTKLMDLGYELGYFSKFENSGEVNKTVNTTQKFTSDSEQVAKQIWQNVFKKFCFDQAKNN